MNSNDLVNDLLPINEIVKMIEEGKFMLIAGDEELLSKLPKGNWIGGTIPYFMGPQGALSTKEKMFVTVLPDYLEDLVIKSYTISNIDQVYNDADENGLSFIIIPSSSEIHLTFAVKAPEYENFGVRPLIGWISGIHLDDIATAKAKVFNGSTGEMLNNNAVVIHGALPSTKYAEINIVNIFEPGTGDTIEFLEDGFSVTDVLVNGQKRNFYDYLKGINHDVRFPLVANYQGVMINISYQRLDDTNKVVYFYAPVFKGMQYKNAEEIRDYVTEFTKRMPEDDLDNISFSCNCILNYLYSELEGKITRGVAGPITFGEIAYQLLNQTLAYLTINDYLDE